MDILLARCWAERWMLDLILDRPKLCRGGGCAGSGFGGKLDISSSRSHPAEIPTLEVSMVRWQLLAVLACLFGVCCGIVVTQIQFKIFFFHQSKSSVQFSSPGWSGRQKFVQFSSWHGRKASPFSSFSSVHSVQFTNSSGPACHVIRKFGKNLTLRTSGDLNFDLT